MGTQVQRTKKPTLPQLMDQAEARVAEVLPAGMDAVRVMRLAKLAIHKNPKIALCDPITVIQCIVDASSLGLEIDSPIGGAHLVPFKKTCTLILDYRGLVRLALRSGFVDKIISRAVYDGEPFEILQGTTEQLRHIPSVDGPGDNDIVGFYALATLANGQVVHEYMALSEVDAIKERSRAGRDGPWVTDFAAMGKKTVFKRLVKWLDLSPEFTRAIEFDNRGEGFSGGTIEDDSVSSITDRLAEKARATADELKAKLGIDVGEGEPDDSEE